MKSFVRSFGLNQSEAFAVEEKVLWELRLSLRYHLRTPNYLALRDKRDHRAGERSDLEVLEPVQWDKGQIVGHLWK